MSYQKCLAKGAPAKKHWTTGNDKEGKVATFETYGGVYGDSYGVEKLHKKDGMWISKAGGSDMELSARGIKITFTKKVTITRFTLTPRNDQCGRTGTCRDRYRKVGLFVDKHFRPSAETSDFFKSTGAKIDMLDRKFLKKGEPLTGQEFKLDWQRMDKHGYAQVSYIEIEYFEPQENTAVTVWSLNCPGGYTSLGHVATKEFELLLPGDVYCIK